MQKTVHTNKICVSFLNFSSLKPLGCPITAFPPSVQALVQFSHIVSGLRYSDVTGKFSHSFLGQQRLLKQDVSFGDALKLTWRVFTTHWSRWCSHSPDESMFKERTENPVKPCIALSSLSLLSSRYRSCSGLHQGQNFVKGLVRILPFCKTFPSLSHLPTCMPACLPASQPANFLD